MDNISQEFLDYFCVRLDQIPVGGNIDECLDWGFKDNNDKIPDGVFIHFEGTINFNYNGVTYMTRDGQDIRKYLSSKGYKDGGGTQTCGMITIGGDATTYAGGVDTSPFTYPAP